MNLTFLTFAYNRLPNGFNKTRIQISQRQFVSMNLTTKLNACRASFNLVAKSLSPKFVKTYQCSRIQVFSRTLQKICERNSIRSREELESFLDGLGVEPPSDKQASGLFRHKAKQSRRQEKKLVETKPATKSNVRNRRKSKGPQKGSQSSTVKTELGE